MSMEHDGTPESIMLFVETARALSARLRKDRPAPSGSETVRVHDGTWPLAVMTDRHHANDLTNVRLHRHLSWQPSVQIDVSGNGCAPNALDLGTDTPVGTADLIDVILRTVEHPVDHAPQYDLLQTAADACGALIGPCPMPIILHAPTPWSPVRLMRADERHLDVPDEARGLLSAIPIMVSPTFWIHEARDDVPAHPRASLRGWSVVAGRTDPLTVAMMLRRYPAEPADAGKATQWA